MQIAISCDALGRHRSALPSHASRGLGQRVSPRIFCPPPLAAGTKIDLPHGAAHHVQRVLRLQVGAALTLFDGEGGEYRAELTQGNARGVAVHIIEHHDIERESPLTVTLVQGLAAADRMDYTVQKAVELGAAAIVPVVATRSVARIEGARAARRVEHWRQIVIAACEQSGRNRLPRVDPPCALAAWLRAPSPAQLRVLLLPDAEGSLADLTQPSGMMELLVGPEGGFTAEESAVAVAMGFRPVRLGTRVLRTETAGAAMLAALQALWGDWR